MTFHIIIGDEMPYAVRVVADPYVVVALFDLYDLRRGREWFREFPRTFSCIKWDMKCRP